MPYKSKMKFIAILLFLISLKTKGQTDTTTLYFDQNWIETNKSNAKFYSLRYQLNDTLWQMKDFFIDGRIQMTGTFSDNKFKNRIGEFRYYLEDGNLKSTSLYTRNDMTNKEIHYYKNGNVDYLYEYDNRTGDLITKEYFKENGDKSVFIEPAFKEGYERMNLFISNNIRYPKIARKRNIEGDVLVKFVIEKDGSIGEVTILESANTLLNDEAIRVVKAMPKWNPGNRDGEPLRIYYSIPIKFRLY